MLNGHGDDVYLYENKVVSNFSSNVYNGLDLSGLKEYLRSHISVIHSYPEPDGCSLVGLLADYHNILPENIILTNGATEAIYLVAQAFGREKATVLIPTFSEYEDACRINNIELCFASSLDEIGGETGLIWICNPNNPTGKVIDSQEIISFIENHPQAIIILDQSYEFFTRKEIAASKELSDYENVIVLHSLTKRYAIPGLRLGYVTACQSLIQKIKKFSMPWSVNALALEAGKYLLENDLSAQLDVSAYLSETKRFQSGLSRIKGITVSPTDTHFFLCRLEKKTAADLKKYLIDRYGILIRDAFNFRGLDKNYFRIATQSQVENDRLIEAIKEWI